MSDTFIDNTGGNITNSVLGAHMQNIANSIHQLPPERAVLVRELTTLQQQAAPAAKTIARRKAEEAAATLEDFTKEAAKEKPRKNLLKVTGHGLIEAATTVAALSGPIIATVEKIRGMFAP